MERENYSDFKEMLKDAISNELPGVRFDENRILKRNNQEVDALTLSIGENICPVVYPEGMFEKYQKGEPIAELVSGVVNVVMNNNLPRLPEFSRSEAEEHIYISLLNSESNKKLLETCPHRSLPGTDLSEVMRWRLSEEASFLVTNDLLSELKMTKEELFDIAEDNLNHESFSIKSMQETIKELMGENVPDDFLSEMMSDTDTPELLVVSREDYNDGSAALASDSVMQAVQNRLNEDFYILPSSRHEILCLGKSNVDDSRHLKTMIGEVNTSCLKPDDFLSDNAFLYDGKAHSISMCAEDGSFMDAENQSISYTPRMSMGGM